MKGSYAEFSPDGKWIINRTRHNSNRQIINIFESKTGRLFRSQKVNVFFNFSISKDNGFLLIKRYNFKTNVYNFTTGKKITSLKNKKWDEIKFSPDNKWFVLSRILYEEDGIWKGKVKITQISTGKLIKKITWSCCKCLGIEAPIPSRIFFSQDGKYFYMHIDCSRAGIFESATGRIKHILNIDEGQYGTQNETVEFSHNGNWLATYKIDENSTKLWDVKTGKLTRDIEGYLSDFHPNLPLLLVKNKGICSLVSLSSEKPLVSFYYIGSNDWVTVHPSGLFDASPGAMEKLYFVQDEVRIELDSLKHKYYEPGLWKKVMSGEPLRILEY